MGILTWLWFQLFSNTDSVELLEVVRDTALNIGDGMVAVGKGIGSIIMLFVVFIYISSILDGGKFQIKMLLPVLIYICVCNFRLVAVPVLDFATEIQSQCVKVANQHANQSLQDICGGAEVESNWFVAVEKSKNKDYGNNPTEKQMREDATSGPGSMTNENENGTDEIEISDSEGGKKGIRGLFSSIGDTIKKLWSNLWIKILEGFGLVQNIAKIVYSGGITGILGAILGWCANIFALMVSALGAIMTGVVVAFGPITWSFAIFPGNHKTIGAWVLRICQFALYSPIVFLVKGFILAILNKLSGLDYGATIVTIACLLAMISVLSSVPSIAAMIIEGAQGSLSLSQGIMSGMNLIQTGISMKTMAGEKGRDDLTNQLLGQIASNTGGSSSGGGPSGQSGGQN